MSSYLNTSDCYKCKFSLRTKGNECYHIVCNECPNSIMGVCRCLLDNPNGEQCPYYEEMIDEKSSL